VVLNSRQSAALRQVECYARTRKEQAGEYLRHILEMSDIEWSRFELSVNKFKQRARVCLHFHPDRLTRNGVVVADSLLLSVSRVLKRIEIRIRNGLNTAHKLT